MLQFCDLGRAEAKCRDCAERRLCLELANFDGYAPFLVDGGKLILINTRLGLNSRLENELSISHGGQVSLVGTISPHGMRANGDAPPRPLPRRAKSPVPCPARPTARGP